MLLGLELTCPVCSITFLYCEHCWRGHKYCSPACRHEGRKRNRRATEKKFCTTLKGKECRRKRQKNFRIRKILGSKVTDHSSQREISKLNSSQKLKQKNSKRCWNCLKSFEPNLGLFSKVCGRKTTTFGLNAAMGRRFKGLTRL